MSVLGKRKLDSESQDLPSSKRHKSSHLDYTGYKYCHEETVWVRSEDYPWWPAKCDFPELFVDKGQPRLRVRWFGENNDCAELIRNRIKPFSLKIEPQLIDAFPVDYTDLPAYERSKKKAVDYEKQRRKHNISTVNISQLHCRQVDINIDLKREENSRLSVMFDIKDMNDKNITKIYNEQKDTANDLYQQMQNQKKVFFMIHAPPQSGKTTIINATITKFYEKPTIKTWVPPENWFFITSLSEIAIRDQLKSRVPTKCRENVFHRGQLTTKLAEKLKKKKNIIIFWDEFHIAAKKGQTQDKFLNYTGWNNLQILFERNIRIIEMSATPDGLLLQHLKLPEENRSIIKMKTGKGYVGPYDLLARGQVQRCKSLHENEICRIVRDIENRYMDHTQKLYHFIRVYGGRKADDAKQQFEEMIKKENLKYIVINFDQKSTHNRNKNINNVIEIKPEVHTIILIKEMLRASMTLHFKNNCGIFYERAAKKTNDSVIVQSFAGRLCGYDTPKHCVVFTVEESLRRKKQLDDSDYSTDIPWNSGTTIFKNNETVVKCATYKNDVLKRTKGKMRKNNSNNTQIHTNISSINWNSQSEIIRANNDNNLGPDHDEYDEKNQQCINKFKTFGEGKLFILQELNGRGQRKEFEQNDDGFYLDSLKTNNDDKKVLQCTEILKTKKYVLKGNKRYKQWVCYRNIYDKTTVEFWVVWRNINQANS